METASVATVGQGVLLTEIEIEIDGARRHPHAPELHDRAWTPEPRPSRGPPSHPKAKVTLKRAPRTQKRFRRPPTKIEASAKI